MSEVFKVAVEEVLKAEGGYVNHPSDRGGETNFGITLGLARAKGYNGQMKDLTRDQAIAIYKAEFWDPLGLDEIAERSQKVAGELFEAGVNVGKGRVTKWLQVALNILVRDGVLKAPLAVDGVAGNGTRAALKSLSDLDLVVLYKSLNIQQGAHYTELATRDSSQRVFYRGWLKRVTFS